MKNLGIIVFVLIALGFVAVRFVKESLHQDSVVKRTERIKSGGLNLVVEIQDSASGFASDRVKTRKFYSNGLYLGEDYQVNQSSDVVADVIEHLDVAYTDTFACFYDNGHIYVFNMRDSSFLSFLNQHKGPRSDNYISLLGNHPNWKIVSVDVMPDKTPFVKVMLGGKASVIAVDPKEYPALWKKFSG